MKLLEVVTPLSIYHGCSTRKMFWEEKFTGEKSCSQLWTWKILFVPWKLIHLGIFICSWLVNYIPILLSIDSVTQGSINLISQSLHLFWLFKARHVLSIYRSLLMLVSYCSSLWIQIFYLNRLLSILLIKETVSKLTPSWRQPILQIMNKLPLVL